jgi:hypothetical protein
MRAQAKIDFEGIRRRSLRHHADFEGFRRRR